MNQIRYVLLAITIIALVGVSALALSIPNTFAPGEVISAAEMNANFAAVEAAVTALEAAVAVLEASQPVVAHAAVTGFVWLTGVSGDAIDLVTVDLTAPAAGVVVVEVGGQITYWGTASYNVVTLAIDTAPGGYLDFIAPNVVAVGTEESGEIPGMHVPVSMQRVFQVAAGTHTFRWKAMDFSGGGNKYAMNPNLTATWYPISQASIAGVGSP